MLPTPSTSHLSFERIYEPAEDSYLLLDVLSSTPEKAFLQHRFSAPSPSGKAASSSPIIAEVGSGSGVVLAFVNENAGVLLGRDDVLTMGLDVNRFACVATRETVRVAAGDRDKGCGLFLGGLVADLVMPLRVRCVDLLIFNPPYVPTSNLPGLPAMADGARTGKTASFEEESHLLALSYAGGIDGMETTNRLLDLLPSVLSAIGVAYILLCAQNQPEVVKEKIGAWGTDWRVETVGSSGKKAGWEKLQIIRIWRNIEYNSIITVI